MIAQKWHTLNLLGTRLRFMSKMRRIVSRSGWGFNPTGHGSSSCSDRSKNISRTTSTHWKLKSSWRSRDYSPLHQQQGATQEVKIYSTASSGKKSKLSSQRSALSLRLGWDALNLKSPFIWSRKSTTGMRGYMIVSLSPLMSLKSMNKSGKLQGLHSERELISILHGLTNI